MVEAVERIPVLGNGDVRTIADAERMIRETGCSGIAIGRGALANPWFFRQLNNWLETGIPGPRGTYEERLQFMETHFRRMVEWRGEHLACLQFRKMAVWHCKALRTGKAIQAILVLIDGSATFQRIVDQLREQGRRRIGANGIQPMRTSPSRRDRSHIGRTITHSCAGLPFVEQCYQFLCRWFKHRDQRFLPRKPRHLKIDDFSQLDKKECVSLNLEITQSVPGIFYSAKRVMNGQAGRIQSETYPKVAEYRCDNNEHEPYPKVCPDRRIASHFSLTVKHKNTTIIANGVKRLIHRQTLKGT